MSLRRRLVAGMVLLLIAAIVTTDVVTLSSLRSFLYGRLDEQVDVAQSQAYDYIEVNYQRAAQSGDKQASADPLAWLTQLSEPTASTPPGLGSTESEPDLLSPAPVNAGGSTAATRRTGELNPALLAARISPDVYVVVLGKGRDVLFRRPSGSSAQQDPAPVLPAGLPVRAAPPVHRFGAVHGVYLPDQPSFTATVKGSGAAYYRGEALAVPGGVLVSLIALVPADQTLSSLARVELIVSVVVVLALLVLTLAIVRFGLRPLEEMTATARAIARGDMRRRIRRTDERSEVGRLGAALNGMLARIEGALAERTASESRLRRFVADASHELRTPLTSIRGYAELMRKGALGDEAVRRRAAERIEHEAARMGVLVDDLLLLARLDQGRPLEREPVDLSRLASDAADAARAAAPERHITTGLTPGVVVVGDAGRLRQVVDNLVQNALVHTPPGTPVSIAVGTSGGHAELVVADQGPGLDADPPERVFDRFYRGSDARSRPGTGLGLSIVAALAEAHGGAATVRSTRGTGAEFRVRLPLAGGPGQGDGADRHDTDANIRGDGTPSGAARERGLGAPARR